MGEPDLAGYDDCDDKFSEIDTDSAEHLRQTAYHAVATRRGTDQETLELQGAWLDVTEFLQGKGSIVGRIRGAMASAATNLQDLDARIEKAVYTVADEVGGIVQWTADITTKTTTALVEAALSPFPQDVPVEPPPILPDPGPVTSGIKTLRQFALDTSHVIGWLTGPNSGRILWTIGTTCDAAIEWLVEGIQQRFPDFAADDALPWLGRDRFMRRGVYENTLAFRARLKTWLDVIRVWGTAQAVLMNVQVYFTAADGTVPTVHVVQHRPQGSKPDTRAYWATLGSDGELSHHEESPSNFDVDSTDAARPAGLADRDMRFYVIIEQDPSLGRFFIPRTASTAVARDPASKNGVLAPGFVGVPSEVYADIEDMADFWRSAGSWLAGIFIHFGPLDPAGSGADYPDGAWQDPLNDTKDGNRITTTWRVFFLNRYAGNRLPASPEPYPV